MRRKKRRRRYKAIDSRTKLRKATKAFLLYPANSSCQICQYSKYMGNLTFHHKNPKQKLFNISSKLLTCPIIKLIREASKCIVVCHNCHGEIHASFVSSRIVDKIPTLDFKNHRPPVSIVAWYCANRSSLRLAS